VLSVPISIDTYKAEVAAAAIGAGSDLVNDVWGLRRDPKMAGTVGAAGVPVIVMHNQQGTEYQALISDIRESLEESVGLAVRAGVSVERISCDPGIGVGKTREQNLEIIRRLTEFRGLGHPILIGPSRKSFIGKTLDLPVDERLEGTAAAVALSIAGGADMVRVHDVGAMVRVVRMADAVVRGASERSGWRWGATWATGRVTCAGLLRDCSGPGFGCCANPGWPRRSPSESGTSRVFSTRW